MRFGILGPLVVADDQERELSLGGRRQRAVLAILLLHAGEVVSSGRLIDELWGEQAPATAPKTLQVYVSHLRKVLGDGVLLTRAGGYVLQAEPHSSDFRRFEAMVDEGRRALAAGEVDAASARLGEALRLWRGPALADFAYESFAQGEIARLEELRQAAVEDRIDADLASGDHAALVAELDGMVREHPLRERLTGQLMLALYRSGRQAEALEAYRRARVRLQDELGLEPGPALKALQMQILEQAASLDWTATPRSEAVGATPPDVQLAVALPAVPRSERKVVTVVSIERVDVLARGERDDPEDMLAQLAPYHERLQVELERFGGTLLQVIGEELTALFGAPKARGDDPERAVRAALSIREWADEHKDFQVRIALSTGDALITIGAASRGRDTMGAADVINMAARVRATAPLNGILVGERTYRATRDAIEYRATRPITAKSEAKPIAVWEAVRARHAPGSLIDARTPFVGRTRELELLVSTLQRAGEERSCQLVTLIGGPGIGKSRLVHELRELAGRKPEAITWRQGRSLPYGEGVTYWALGEMVKQEAGILESDSSEEAAGKLRRAVRARTDLDADWIEAQLQPLVGLSPEQRSSAEGGEAATAWRRFLEALAEDAPTVVVFEDLHWANDGLLDFIDDLVDRAIGVPLLVLGTARPELLERRPGWGGGKLNTLVLSLPPLVDDDATRLLVSLFDRPLIDAATLRELLARVGGNPLYAEQYARILREKGSLEDPPDSVQGIISARLDALTHDEKQLLQDAAVVGSVFWLGSVEALDARASGHAEQLLERLERKDLVRRARRSSVSGEAEYAFRHALLREVAYRQIPRAARSLKHQRAAAWIEALGRPEDHAEMLAHHYVSAFEYAQAAGQAEATLIDRARVALRGAGDRAFALASYAAAARFYGAALELWPATDSDRVWLLVQAGRAKHGTDRTGIDLLEQAFEELRSGGDADGAAEVAVEVSRKFWLGGERDAAYAYIDRALELTHARRDSPARAYALVERAAYHSNASEHPQAIELLREALSLTSALGMDELRARALDVLGGALELTGDFHGIEDSRSAIALARESKAFSRLIVAELNLQSNHFFRGDLAAARDELPTVRHDVESYGTSDQREWLRVVEAHQDVLDGRWREAARTLDEVIAKREVEGVPYYLDPACHALRASIELARGDLDAASTDSSRALDRAQMTKDPQILAPALVMRAMVLLAQKRLDNASASATAALQLAPVLVAALHDLVPAATAVEFAWLLRALGREGDLLPTLAVAPPIPWVRAATAILAGDPQQGLESVARIGAPSILAYTRLHAGERLFARGYRTEAVSQLEQALDFYRAVGAHRYAREAEALTATVAAGRRSASSRR